MNSFALAGSYGKLGNALQFSDQLDKTMFMSQQNTGTKPHTNVVSIADKNTEVS